MSVIIFWFALTLPSHEQPIIFQQQVESLSACLCEVHEVLTRPPHTLLIEGGTIEAGCLRAMPPSIEH